MSSLRAGDGYRFSREYHRPSGADRRIDLFLRKQAGRGRRSGGQDEEEILKTYQTEDYDYLANSATGMDCTGLMHRTPSNENEMESYQEVYQYLPPNVRVDAMDGKDSHK